MPRDLTRYLIHAAGEIGLHDIVVERRSKHMRLTARTETGLPVLVHFSKESGDWRVRRNVIAEMRRQARGMGRMAWAA